MRLDTIFDTSLDNGVYFLLFKAVNLCQISDSTSWNPKSVLCHFVELRQVKHETQNTYSSATSLRQFFFSFRCIIYAYVLL